MSNMQLRVFILFPALFILVNPLNQDLPSSFPKCKRNDPNLNKCLLEASETVRPHLLKGVPELGIPSVEPFLISEIKLEQGTRSLNFRASFTNIIVGGLGGYKFSQFDFDVPHMQWLCRVTVPNVKMNGTFEVLGQILFVPVEGNGHFFATVEKVDVTVVHKAELYKKKRVDYMKPISTNISIALSSPEIRFDGLANAEMKRLIDVIITDNMDELVQDFKPTMENVVAQILERDMFKHVEDKIPYDKLYPTK